MPKDTKTLGNNKAWACESLGFVHKKRLCQRFDTTSPIVTQPPVGGYAAFRVRLCKQPPRDSFPALFRLRAGIVPLRERRWLLNIGCQRATTFNRLRPERSLT